MRSAIVVLAILPMLAPAAEVAQDILDRAVELRHRIHQNPELSNQEHETAALVAEELRELGMEVHTGIAKTGVVGILRGGRDGPVVAVRADMDALPVKEDSGLPFASEVTGTWQGETVPVAHACGHDVHTAVQLGVARHLAGMREDLPGTVMFVFQPAEEGVPPGEEGGASLMVEEGLFDIAQPSAMFALHAFPNLEIGEVGWTSGPTYASSDHFIIELEGRQAHGAWPHLSVDTVLVAAETIQALQSIRSRNMHPREAGVVTVGIVRGGERFNIIPSSVRLEGTVRAYDVAVQDLVEERMTEILDGITAAYGADYELTYERNNPATVNDPELAAWARGALEGSLSGERRVVDADPVMGAEDFAWYLDHVPGFYFRLGVTDPAHGSGPLHTPSFRADDAAIPVGVEAMSGLVLRYLEDAPLEER